MFAIHFISMHVLVTDDGYEERANSYCEPDYKQILMLNVSATMIHHVPCSLGFGRALGLDFSCAA